MKGNEQCRQSYLGQQHAHCQVVCDLPHKWVQHQVNELNHDQLVQCAEEGDSLSAYHHAAAKKQE
jgi:hypothetical protein